MVRMGCLEVCWGDVVDPRFIVFIPHVAFSTLLCRRAKKAFQQALPIYLVTDGSTFFKTLVSKPTDFGLWYDRGKYVTTLTSA